MQWYCTILDKSTLFAQLHPQGKGESKCRGLSVVPNETFEVHEREPPSVSRHCMCGLMLPLPVTPFCPFRHCGTCTVQCMHAYPQTQEVVVCLCEPRIHWLLCPVLSVSPAPCLSHTHTHTHTYTYGHTQTQTCVAQLLQSVLLSICGFPLPSPSCKWCRITTCSFVHIIHSTCVDWSHNIH